MNSNAFHNVANIASLALAGGTTALLSSGCVQSATGALDCSHSWINPVYTAIAIVALQAAKLIVNIIRDGFGGLIKPQPPVSK